MYFESDSTAGYGPLWNKYRPAILQLMVAAAEGPKQYQFFAHEFRKLNPREKSLAFTLLAHQGKSVNKIKRSAATDLLEMLTSSRRAAEMLEKYTYEFTLDRDLILHVSLHPGEEPEAIDDETNAD